MNEEEITKFWEKNKVFEKSVEERPKDKQYVFYDGPPFATGLPHYGHILGLTSKDLFPRFWTMKGFRVERKWGWDCHGLPIENIAEKELGIKDKREIEAMGIPKFNEFCRSKVLFFADEWKKTVRKMGKWIDFDNSYKTMDNSYMESVWYIFKKLYDEKFIYEGKKILMYCPHCQTPLANAEIAMDNSYKDVTEKTITAKFRLKDSKDTYFLAWTTTPWTLIGNVALAVNEKLNYVKIKRYNEYFILAKDLLSVVDGEHEIVEEFKGSKIVGMEYEPLYEVPTDKKGFYVINGGDEVTAEDGTGIVHMAAYGDFDYEMIKKYDLPLIQHVGKDGKIILGPEKFKGDWFKKADAKVLDDLEDRNLLFSAEKYTHSYPFCYRCETPLFYNAVDSWFVDIQKIKKTLIERNKEINWHPNNIKEGRFKYILETAPDWSISRNRFWATALPVWKCADCGETKVIGSVKELQENAIEKVPNDVDLHRHVVDEYHLKCSCGKTMNRIPEVFDCWFESGSMPYAAKHYPFENKDWYADNYPADFISEYIAQVRAWFYYMHVLGVLLFDKAPFRNVVVSGNVLAADGSKMSKSKNNFPNPNLMFEKYGADSLRFYLMASPLMRAQDLNFNEDGLKEVYRKVFVLLSNVAKFYTLFGSENSVLSDSSSKELIDVWAISKTNLLVRNVTNALEDYDTVLACSEISSFIDELSTWYVRRSRNRFKANDKNAVKTLAYILSNLSKVIAPITPFIAEDIHQTFRKANNKIALSVHLEAYPTFNAELIKEDVNENMKMVREIVSAALDAREKAKIPIRQALSEMSLFGVELSDDYLKLIKEELNVKKITLKKGDFLIELDTKITPELLREGVSRDLIRKINNLRKNMKLTIQDRITLFVESSDELILKSVEEFKKDIMNSVQADKFEAKIPEDVEAEKITVNTKEVMIAVKK